MAALLENQEGLWLRRGLPLALGAKPSIILLPAIMAPTPSGFAPSSTVFAALSRAWLWLWRITFFQGVGRHGSIIGHLG